MNTQNTQNTQNTHIRGAFAHAPDAFAQVLLERVQQLEQMERPKQALDLMRLVLEMRQEDSMLWVYYGALARSIQNMPIMLSAFQRALELDSENRDALIQLGEVLCQRGRAAQGIPLLRAAFELGHNPSKPPAQQDLHTIRAGAVLEAIQMATRRAIAKYTQTMHS